MCRLVDPSYPHNRDIWQFPRIFQPPMPDHGEQVFFKPYTPHHPVHREEELLQLVIYFKERLIESSQSFNFAIISGLEGVGKGLLVKVLHQRLLNLTKITPHLDHMSLFWIRMSCRQHNTAQILCEMLRHIQPQLLQDLFLHQRPGTDLVKEVWVQLIRVLRGRGLTVFLTLDSIENFTIKERANLFDYFEQIGKSIHLGGTGYRKASLNLMILTNNPLVGKEIASSVTVEHQNTKLRPYSAEQRLDILQVYAEVGLQQEAYNRGVISKVEEFSRGRTDMRYAIDLLWRAAKIAGDEGGTQITEEYVVRAFREERDNILSPILGFRVEQQLLLYSLAKLLQDSTRTPVKMPILVKKYEYYCEELDVKPHRSTTLYYDLKDFEALNLITRQVTKPGTPAILSLKRAAAEEIIQLLIPVIDRLKGRL